MDDDIKIVETKKQPVQNGGRLDFWRKSCVGLRNKKSDIIQSTLDFINLAKL